MALGIVELKKRGVYASALIKKRKYWPKYIKGNVIRQHFDDKAVGDWDSWKGNMDEVPFHVYAMKEPDYVMSLMSTHGTNLQSGKETCHEWVDSDGTNKTTKVNYPEVVGNHFLYQHSVDNHNNKRHSSISLEVVWGTKYWPNHVFSFLLAVTEVNVNLAAQYFGGMKQVGQIEFRKLLAKTLIFNSYYDDKTDNTPEKKRKKRDSGHCLITLSKGKMFGNANCRGKQQLSATQVQHMQQKGTYLLHVLSRDLLVCRMLRLPSCMLRKQSCITELNSAAQKLKKMACQ